MNKKKDQSYVPESSVFEKKTRIFLSGILFKQFFNYDHLNYLIINLDEKTEGDIDIQISFSDEIHLVQVKSSKKPENITQLRCKEGLIQLFKRYKEKVSIITIG